MLRVPHGDAGYPERSAKSRTCRTPSQPWGCIGFFASGGDVTKTAASDDLRRVERWRVDVTAGPSRGKVMRLEQPLLRVGSAESNDLVIDDPNVSRNHLEVRVHPTGLHVR